MISKLKTHKWRIIWGIFFSFLVVLITIGIRYEGGPWVTDFIQISSTLMGVYLTLAIFLQSKEESDRQFLQQLEYLQKLNANQILALHTTTDKQIQALHESTDKQINTLHDLTERQIDALQKNTFDQISSFENQIKEVTGRLTDNSILLAEILGRELEKSIELYNNTIRREEERYKDLSNWKLLRTPQEKEAQLNHQWERIQKVKNIFDYIVQKYNSIRSFLGYKEKTFTDNK